MISVAEARSRILENLQSVPTEVVSLAEAHGRVLAEDVIAHVTQPPVAVSAMDGYAVRAADVKKTPIILTQVGEAPAGGSYDVALASGETVRIFTGAPLPEGADSIVIQENTEAKGNQITIFQGVTEATYVRPKGLDFTADAVNLFCNKILSARDIGLAAAMNVPWLTVRRRPRVAILATGDEIVRPGEPIGENQIVSSNTLALAALIRAEGGEAVDLGIARDDEDSLRSMAAGIRGADMLVTLGGASVGDHDLVKDALGEEGLKLDFWRIAMRPGKPLMFGNVGGIPMLGLPGNPVSSLVCGLIYLRPTLHRLQMLPDFGDGREPAILGGDLVENDQREDYLRAELSQTKSGEWLVTPFSKQDSSMLTRLARARCLLVRAPFAPPASAGERVDIIPFRNQFFAI